jgi:hypothetical protein
MLDIVIHYSYVSNLSQHYISLALYCREEETNLVRYDGIGSYGDHWGGVMRWTKCHTVNGMYNNLEGDN